MFYGGRMDIKTSIVEYEMEDGMTVAMSTAPILLKRLKSKNKEAYKNLSKFMISGVEEDDILQIFNGLYNAYLNASVEEESPMSLEFFMENANQNFQYNVEKIGELINPKKKEGFDKLSSEQ